MRVERNLPCPCGKAAKYKKCCYGRIDWEKLLNEVPSEVPFYLSLRGKNLVFLRTIADALQLDNETTSADWPEIKRAVTLEAVRKIHEAILFLWPNSRDLARVLRDDKEAERGLYVGSYEPAKALRGLTRHSLYSDRLVLFDPFVYPVGIKPEFDPIENPQSHIVNTTKWVGFWLRLWPWIEADLVHVIRNPADFDRHLLIESANWQTRIQKRYEEDYATALDETLQQSWNDEGGEEFRLFTLLSQSDEELLRSYIEHRGGATESEAATFLRFIKREREAHSYYSEGASGAPGSQFVSISTGANYYIAKSVAAVSGAHLITDLPVRWKDMELDRRENGVELGEWTPFAHAFSGLKLSCLDDVPLSAALRLRQDGRLEGMRSFLGRAWRAAKSDDDLAETNVAALKDELAHHVAEASEEWKRIDRDLLLWVTAEAGAAVAASGAVAAGGGAWLAGGWALAGLGQLSVAWLQRNGFNRRYPAAFFLDLDRNS